MKIEKVNFTEIGRFETGFYDRFMEKTSNLVKNTQFVAGPEIGILEKKLTDLIGCKHAIGCANGTDAIQIALRACGVGRGDAVLLPDMTFWASFEAIVNVGADPITIDVDINSLHLSAEAFESAVKKFKPKAAIIVHLYGWAIPETKKIRDIAKNNNVLLIEDGAQCFNTLIDNEQLLKNAYISTTSFYPAKVLGASGDAGAVFTNDDELAQKSRQLINHGRTSHYSYGLVGWNSRIGHFESAFLNLSLEHLNQRISSRLHAIQRYESELTNLPLKTKRAHKSVNENGYCHVSITDEKTRENLTDHLKKFNIGYGTIYPGAMSLQEGAKGILKNSVSFGHADKISKTILNLPCFAYISDPEIDYVIKTVKSFFN